MANVYLALGTNIGDKLVNINKALTLLREELKIKRTAPLYESTPVGFTNQDNFFNTVIEVDTSLKPLELLKFIKKVEERIGRKKRFLNGPREIDVDIVFFDALIFKDDVLEIPHPRVQERDFVLVPMSLLAPKFLHPVFNKTIEYLLNRIKNKDRAILRIISG